MTSSIASTPRTNFLNKTPSRTPRRLCRRALPPETPDYLNHTGGTPASIRRRVCKDKSTEISNGLTVAVRVRPMNNRELKSSTVYDTVSVKHNELTVKAKSPGCVGIGITHTFQYDNVFWSTEPGKNDYATQQDVFDAMGKPLLDSAFKGYNACLFAYGQTGSGKSYSMMGDQCALDVEQNESSGIIPRFSYELFSRITELPACSGATVEVSYFEIYNEKIYDLLAVPTSMTGLDRRTPLKVREHPVWGPYVVNLSPHVVKSFTELRNMLRLGNKYRATGATLMNEKSSRSHSIVSIELSVNEMDNEGVDSGRRSKISLVDLAGSERVGSTSSSSDDRHREGVSINQSLLTLGKVIAALADPRKSSNFIPYRESILTWLLRESLGGNSLTSMLATITPASSHVDETLATLRYACQARSIVNRAYVNENPHDRLIRELRAEVERLRALRLDCERQSIAPAEPDVHNKSLQELSDLRHRLSLTEHNLEEARQEWQQRFLETKRRQKQELAEAASRKHELELHVRVKARVHTPVHISPYKSDFLQKLQALLNDKEEPNQIQALVDDTNEWCATHDLSARFSYDVGLDKIIVADQQGAMRATCLTAHLKNRQFYSVFPEDFLNCLDWEMNETVGLNGKCIIYKYMQQMRNAMTAMSEVVDEDDNLRVAFRQLNVALRHFDKVFHSSKRESEEQDKSVNLEM